MTTRRRIKGAQPVAWRSPAVVPLFGPRPRKPRPKASGTARGYGYPHARLRAWWKPQVEAGLVQCHAVVCLEPGRWIKPGSEWHLGHTPDRTAWTGPEHAKCNLSE